MLYAMAQSLCSLLVHLIFSTKDRCPFLGKSELLQPARAYLGGVLPRVQCPAITIGGTADHVHAFFQLARTQNVAKVVEILKSHSSQWLKSQGIPAFAWQRGYGCFSVGKSQAEALVQYIASQAEHHRKISFQDELREILRKYGVAFDERYLWD
jgi:REP element-mobilizing transposase RayT